MTPGAVQWDVLHQMKTRTSADDCQLSEHYHAKKDKIYATNLQPFVTYLHTSQHQYHDNFPPLKVQARRETFLSEQYELRQVMSYQTQISIWGRLEPTAKSFPIYDKHGYTAMQSLCATRTLHAKDEATSYNTVTNW